jgi:hypothetical protein
VANTSAGEAWSPYCLKSSSVARTSATQLRFSGSLSEKMTGSRRRFSSPAIFSGQIFSGRCRYGKASHLASSTRQNQMAGAKNRPKGTRLTAENVSPRMTWRKT